MFIYLIILSTANILDILDNLKYLEFIKQKLETMAILGL